MTVIPPPRPLPLTPSCDAPLCDLDAQLAAARRAQAGWRMSPWPQRRRLIRQIRHAIVERAEGLARSVHYPFRRSEAETVAAEILPLADACRFLEREASEILRPQRLGSRSRPLWLRDVSVELHHEPWGIVLVLGAANYPLLLPGIQALQAIVAGNAVLWKPGQFGAAAAELFSNLLCDCGVEADLLQVLPEDPETGQAAMRRGVDKVVLTGSADTGLLVAQQLAETLTPATMELSGCDAVLVLPSADLEQVARALAFGLRFNHSATCIAPRRVFVPHSLIDALESRLVDRLRDEQSWGIAAVPLGPTAADSWSRAAELVAAAMRDGARCSWGGVTHHEHPAKLTLVGPTVLRDVAHAAELVQTDLFAPIVSLIPVPSIDQAVQWQRACRYALGVSIFGDPRESRSAATAVDAGCVVINDLIVPTADPRVPFGGRKQSGYGVTRGAAGLLEMTQLKSVVTRRGRWLPHLDLPSPHDARLLTGMLAALHGGTVAQRLRGLRQLLRAALDQRAWSRGLSGTAPRTVPSSQRGLHESRASLGRPGRLATPSSMDQETPRQPSRDT